MFTTMGSVLSVLALLIGCSLPEGDAETEAAAAPADASRNRLAQESSPYLLAHSHNPVDWYPWGPEALEKARREDKPIFLSIGYSSCHWCHVMEKKVFSDARIAREMNERFVNIKVDREERPDIDEIYMTALQMYFQAVGSSQSGGWPLSIFLTPDGRPLGGGTYFPPEDEEGRTGFTTLMRKVHESWRDNRKQMETNADILARAVQAASRPRAALTPPTLDRQLLAPVLEHLADSYDAEYGGFGFDPRHPDRPKFPVPTRLGFLQYQAGRHDDDRAAKMLHATLDRMAAGGIHDQIGGGFHRYSTDRRWRVPHFEKMLYDNALLADIYAEAFRQTGQPHYRAVAEGTIGFVLRELTDGRGGFYSALDADSDGEEGKYYVWSDQELATLLSAEELETCRVVYGTAASPNFELGHVLQVVRPLDEAASELKISAAELEDRLASIARTLLAARQQRAPPACDDKVLTSWNGLMIRALARAGVILERSDYVDAARRAAEFVLAELRDETGRLRHSWRAGAARHAAYLDDYAYLVDGLLALRLATGDEKWSAAAQRLTDAQLQLFWDDSGKGCYFTANDHEALLARTKNGYDTVLPSGNSVTVRNLVRLSSLTPSPELRDRARQTLEAFAPLMAESPGGLASLAWALSEFLDTKDSDPDQRTSRRRRLGIAPDAEIVLAGGAAPSARGEKDKSRKKPEPVTAQAFLSVDRLPAAGKCRLLVRLEIAEGWHVHANPPGDPEFDLPTELSVTSSLGTELTRVSYPAGRKVSRGKGEKPLLQYDRRVQFVGELEVPADAAGRQEELAIEVAYQACDARQCLPLRTVKLKLTPTVARRGERVLPAHEKLFGGTPARQ